MNIHFNKLQADLLKRHLGPFLFCFFTLMFLLLMQFLILHIDKLIGKDIPTGIVIELIITNLAYMVVLAAPMAVLVATLMAFGKFSELNELTALRASGINPFKIIRPVLIASIFLFIFLAWFSNQVLPEANHKARSLFIDIRLKKPAFDLKPNIFYEGIEGYTFLVKRIDGATDSLYNVTLFQKQGSKRDRAYIKAEKGLLESKGNQALTLHLIDGSILQFTKNRRDVQNKMHRQTFQKHIMNLDLADLTFLRSDPDDRNRSDRTMSAQAMLFVVDSLQSEIQNQTQRAGQNRTLELTDGFSGKRSIMRQEDEDPDTIEHTGIESDYVFLNSINDEMTQKYVIQESIRQLEDYRTSVESILANIEWREQRIARFMVEVHKKLSVPFACITFILFGAPVGIMTRRGNFGFAALISTVVLTFYWVSLIQGEKLADRLLISPFWGMWTFNVVLSLIGIILILHLSTDLRINRLFKRDA